MLDRRTAPPIFTLRNFSLSEFTTHKLDNGIPVYLIDKGTQDILKVDFVYFAGRWQEDKKLASRVCARMLREGTRQLPAAEFAEQIDFYAGTLRSRGNLDTGDLTLFCLSKHFEKLIPLVAEILKDPVFPQSEIDTYISNQIQRLKLELSKNEVIAYRELTAAIYGHDHPYGYNSTAELYETITRKNLVDHFLKFFRPGNCQIIVSGKMNEQVLPLLNHYFGFGELGPPMSEKSHIPKPTVQKHFDLQVPDSVQSAIRIGREVMGRHHPDYFGFFILNTLLGGYFGSRLMSNIREEKGYTYGIYSNLDTMLHGSCFYIGTEVTTEFTELTLKEIYFEIDRLRKEPVGMEELERLKNYLLGTLLNSLDGPFNVASVVRTLVLSGLDSDYFEGFLQTIQNITPKDLQQLANKWLDPETFHQVVVR